MIRSLIRVIFAAMPAVALAQGGPGSIEGRVSDSQQLALSRAVVELVDTEGHIVQKVVADETGHYKIESVSPASYTVSFSAVGFEPSKEGPVTVADHQAVFLDAILRPRQVLESVTVRAENDRLVASMTDIPLSLLRSRLQYNATRSASDFAGIAEDGGVRASFPDTSVGGSTTNLDARGEERLAERKRIAQELHDTLLQGFLAVSMQLHAAVDHLPVDCAAAKPRFSGVLQLLDRVLEQGRCAVQGLRSPNERTASLGKAFAGVPNDLGLPPAVEFRVVVHGRERELRAGLRDEVYRIGREAIVNACRHSRARDIETGVEYLPTGLRIAVRDNGCGIDPRELQWGRNGHWGLQGMRERAERIGARLRLWSSVALGTEVVLCVPDRVAFE